MSKKPSKFQLYTWHYEDMLYNIIKSYIHVDGLPDSIDSRFLKDEIIKHGYFGAFLLGQDLVVSGGAISGLDREYRPTTFTPANPFISKQPLTIGKNCTVCFLTENYRIPFNFKPLVNMYARRLADLDMSVDTSARNSRVTNIMIVNDDKEAIRTAQILDEMYNDGRASVMSYKTAFTAEDKPSVYPIRAKDNIVTTELADARRNILADFYSYLGINTIAVDKKERTNLLEMNSNGEQLGINRDIWLNALSLWANETNALFSTDISFSLYEEKETEVNAYD